jgi:hypothetical protein
MKKLHRALHFTIEPLDTLGNLAWCITMLEDLLSCRLGSFTCTIELFIIDQYPIIKHIFRSLSFVFHFERFKMLKGALPQALEIIFEVQRKTSNEKIARRKISFSTYKTSFFFLFSSLCTRPTFRAHKFLVFLFILNDLKCYRSTTFSSTNHL